MAPIDLPKVVTLPVVPVTTYSFGREVARGGMGRVVAAHDLRIGRPVAVKELLDSSPSTAARFEREARITARLQHPGIVPIYEIGTWPDGTPFYAMRLVEGKTLSAALAEADNRLALLPSVIAACEAIAFAHAHDVIHRDLKPSNIMVGAFGETVVIDWGLAKTLDEADDRDVGPYRSVPESDLTAVGEVMGTAAYMPPEQANAEPVDRRADVYSLGAITCSRGKRRMSVRRRARSSRRCGPSRPRRCPRARRATSRRS
jgi:serine/threonine protein kinase